MIQPKSVLIFEGVEGEGLHFTQPIGQVSLRRIHVQTGYPELQTGFRRVGQGWITDKFSVNRIRTLTKNFADVVSQKTARFRYFLRLDRGQPPSVKKKKYRRNLGKDVQHGG